MTPLGSRIQIYARLKRNKYQNSFKPDFDSYFEFRTFVDREFRVKISKTGQALSSIFYGENRFSQVKCELLH
ncbi:MAG: hypothetical protein ACI8ZN_002312 [Bacteroidia bacterium]|jgi:hypothetical protein